MNRLAAILSCLAVLVVACDKKADAPKPADAPAGDKPAAAPAKPAIGLNAPGNDPKIVELAKKALGCKWEDKVFDPFDTACPEYKAWKEEKALFADKKGEPTLVAFIEDPDDKVRYLGEQRLSDDLADGELTDKALVARVVTVAEKSKVQRDADPLGGIIGNSKVTDPELWPRVKALVMAPETHVNMRLPMIKWLLPNNPDSEELFTLTRELTKNTTFERAAGTAMEAFLYLKDKPARCDVWLENLENPPGGAADHAGDAMSWLSRPGVNCESHYDKMLAAFEARVKGKTANSALFLQGGRMICPPKGKATPAQVKKLVALAHKVAEDKTLEGGTRSMALETVSDCDPKGKKAYLSKFTKDKDPDVKSRAEFLSKKK